MKGHLIVVASLGLLVSCKEGTTEETESIDTGTGPECTEDDHCGQGEICEDEVCEVGDRDNSFDDGFPVRQNDPVEGEINPPGDVDYYAYGSPGDEWLRIQTTSPDGDDALDTVLVVYASNGATHMAMDDFATGSVYNYDSVSYVYLPSPDTWFISVEDRSTWYGETPRGGPSFDYTLELLSFGSITRETDSADEPSASVDMDSGNTIWAVGVNLEEEGDTDYIAVAMPWDEAPLQVYGVSDVPGSDAQVQVEIVDPAGELVVSKDNVGPDGIAGYYPAEEGDYLVQTRDRLGGGGADYWYVLYFRTRENGYTAGLEEEPNDDADSAHVLDDVIRETSSGELYTEFSVMGEVDHEGDEDWFALDITDPYLSVRCSASIYGALGNPAIDLHAPDGSLATTITEGNDNAPDLSNLESESGTWWARVYDEDGTWGPGAWYTCTFWNTDFEVAT